MCSNYQKSLSHDQNDGINNPLISLAIYEGHVPEHETLVSQIVNMLFIVTVLH